MASKSNTGLIYDDRMAEHCCTFDPNNPECPERYLSPLKKIKEYGLLQRCHILPSRQAVMDELLLLHKMEYIDEIKNTAGSTDEEGLEKLASKYDGIFLNSKTYDCALLSAGCTLDLVSAVLSGDIKNGMALVRPPGHHAMESEACGYCFFNNVAIAAKLALEKHKLKRILIVDWDVHHGQATQRTFYDDPRVLYLSIHRYENGSFWPHLRESNFDYVGGESAKGSNVNVPLNSIGLGNADYLAIFNNILLPIAYEFCPELVLISAGYDAAIGCPEGEMKVTPAAYGHFVNLLSPLAGGRVCVILEGGYCISSLSEGVAFTLKSLLGDPCSLLSSSEEVHESCIESILNVVAVQRPFWNSLRIQNIYDSNFDDDGNDKHKLRIHYAGNPLEGFTTFQTRGYYPIQSTSVVEAYVSEIKDLVTKCDFHVPTYQTGFILDAKEEFVNCEVTTHIETSHDIKKFYHNLRESGLLKLCVYIDLLNSKELLNKDDFAAKIEESFELLHPVKESLEKEFEKVKMCQNVYSSVTNVYEKLLLLTDAVMNKVCSNGFALIRPVGHYPDSSLSSGMSVFPSAAVAAKYLISKYKLNRILIIDLGKNSKYDFFQETNQVLYISLHYQDSELSNSEVREKQVENAKSKGYNISIPFHQPVRDGDYLAALFHVVLPISYEFCPEFTFVCVAYEDFSDRVRLSPSFFSIMTKVLQGFGKNILISECGFSCDTGPDTAAHCLSALLNQTPVPLRPSNLTDEACETIRDVVKVQKDNWKCLAFDLNLPDCFIDPTTDSTHISRSTSNLRRQSSNPVKIPKNQNEGWMSIALEHEMKDDFASDACFCVTPLENCPHLELLQPLPNEGLNIKATCQKCNDPQENWVCLHCYQVYCGRFINQHMVEHGANMKHYLTLSYSDLSVWCYACEAYIHNNLLQPIKDHAHDKKFGVSDEASDALFCVIPLDNCPHLEMLQPLPNEGLDVKATCQICKDSQENWVCLHCYKVYCGRFINQHMVEHGTNMKHPLTLSYSDLSVWCYACEAYIHNNLLQPIKDHAHDKKFGVS